MAEKLAVLNIEEAFVYIIGHGADLCAKATREMGEGEQLVKVLKDFEEAIAHLRAKPPFLIPKHLRVSLTTTFTEMVLDCVQVMYPELPTGGQK